MQQEKQDGSDLLVVLDAVSTTIVWGEVAALRNTWQPCFTCGSFRSIKITCAVRGAPCSSWASVSPSDSRNFQHLIATILRGHRIPVRVLIATTLSNPTKAQAKLMQGRSAAEQRMVARLLAKYLAWSSTKTLERGVFKLQNVLFIIICV